MTRSGKGVKAWEREPTLKLAMASCQQALTLTGTQSERLIQIDILLLMVDIVTRTKPTNISERERYFYRAVELAGVCYKKDYLKTPHGQRIKEVYCTYINTKFGNNFNNKECCDFLDFMQFKIDTESKKGISQRI